LRGQLPFMERHAADLVRSKMAPDMVQGAISSMQSVLAAQASASEVMLTYRIRLLASDVEMATPGADALTPERAAKRLEALEEALLLVGAGQFPQTMTFADRLADVEARSGGTAAVEHRLAMLRTEHRIVVEGYTADNMPDRLRTVLRNGAALNQMRLLSYDAWTEALRELAM